MPFTKEQKTFYFETYGCQMNVNDSEKVAGLLRADGLEPAPSPETADFVFINTCAVREKSTEKLYSSLGRLNEVRKERGGALRIGVGGCVAQLHGTEILERAPSIDILVGPHNLVRVPELLKQVGGEAPRVDLDRKADAFAVPPEQIDHSSPYRVYVTVMEGCSMHCSSCDRADGPPERMKLVWRGWQLSSSTLGCDSAIVKIDDKERTFPITGLIRHPFVPPPQFMDLAFFFMSGQGMERFGIQEGKFSSLYVRVTPYSADHAKEVATAIKNKLAKQDILVAQFQYEDPNKHWGRTYMDAMVQVQQLLRSSVC